MAKHIFERSGVTHKNCTRCGLYLPFTEFCNDKRRGDGMHRECRTCKRDQITPLRPRHQGYAKKHYASRPWISLIANARSRAVRKQLPFNLDDHVDELKRRVEKAECEISGVRLRFDRERSPYSASIDRIDSKKGYTIENVRIIAWGLNRFLADWNDEEVLLLAAAWVNRNV